MTQQFDEGVREILVALSLGTTALTTKYILNQLDKRPEPAQEKIEALGVLQKKAPEAKQEIQQAKQVVAKKAEERPEVLFPKTSPKPWNWDISTKEVILDKAARYITPFEIYGSDFAAPENSKFRNPYEDDKKYWTIGIGTLIGKGSYKDKLKFLQDRKKQGKPSSITYEEAIEMFQTSLNKKYDLLERVFGDQWNTFSDEMKVALIDITYRGDLISRQTGKLLKFVGHIKNKKFKEAAAEYLNHKEYKKRLKEGRDSVVRRMQSNYKIMKEEGSK